MNKLHQIVANFNHQARSVIAVVAGSGLVAQAAVEAAVDFLMVLNAGLYRSQGVGSLASFLPYGNANDQTEALLLEHVLPRAQETPVVAGVFAPDLTKNLESWLQRLRCLNVSGIVNWPAMGFFDGRNRQILESEDLGVGCEIAMLALARSLGFVTFGFALGQEDAHRFAASGVDAMILNIGLTRNVDDIRDKRDQLQHAIARLNSMIDAVRRANRDPLCLAFGGPITAPEDLEQLFCSSPVHGFAGGSVFERLPVHSIISSTVRRFKSIALHRVDDPKESGLGHMIGQSPPMEELYGLVKRIAPYDVNVCIEGESGTGKELVATQMHRLSPRANQPLVTLNCGAIPDTLLESELFGHEKGAFTGADRRRLGKIELAHRGTLFLDEIADLSPRGQVALLRAIQQREITRVGGESSIPIDVRIITASNQSLPSLIEQGSFRADLYYRLNHITVSLPPLRERLEDISLLVQDALSRLQIQLDKKLIGLSRAFQDKLHRHGWPGNVRELQHVVGQAALREDGPVLEGYYFTPMPLSESAFSDLGKHSVKQSRQDMALRALSQAHGNKSRAAAALGITRRTLYAWLDEKDS